MLTKILLLCLLPLVLSVLQVYTQNPLESVVMKQSAQLDELKAQVEVLKNRLDTEIPALQKLVGKC